MFNTWAEAEEAYDDMLDETGPVTVAGYDMDVSRVLREVDPIAYRCGLHDFIDAEGIDSDDLDGSPSF